MPSQRVIYFIAVFFSVALHALGLTLAGNHQFKSISTPQAPQPVEKIVFLEPLPTRPEKSYKAPTSAPKTPPKDMQKTPTADRQLESMQAPPAPTAEEWAIAAKYTLKNSKGYRYSWGQQVRSMMGTAMEGPDQGVVRFRVEIAPDGTLAQLETLWSTSAVAEKLARKAIENMPALPPTPNGKPLVFEKTISFQPFASDGPPLYKDDCLPDPPVFRNPFAWDGKSPQVRAEPAGVQKLSPQEQEDCRRLLPRDSIDAESAHDQRLLDQWGQKN